MATSAPPRCRRRSDCPEPVVKTDLYGYFSPDILRVFMDDQDCDTQPLLSSGAGVANPPPRFPQFRFLPPELRWMVWEAALPEPTVVPRTWSNSQFRYVLQRKVPTVLQACAEARRLLVARGQTATVPLAPRLQLVQPRKRVDEGVYMNWRTDSVWICRGCKSRSIPPPMLGVESGFSPFP